MGLRETLEAATPGGWGMVVEAADLPDERYGDIVAYIEVGNLETKEMVGDFTPHLNDGSWEGASRAEADSQARADAQLAALAPELASLVLDMGEALRADYVEGDDPDVAALLARLDQLGVREDNRNEKEQT